MSGSLIRGAALVAVAVGAPLVVLGGLLAGSAAAYGALVGAGLAVVVLGFGTVTVDLVAGRLPAASLLVALLTYVLQVLALGLVFLALTGSGLLDPVGDPTLDRRWLATAVVATTLAWSIAQVRLATRARIPAYDLSPRPTGPSEVGSQVRSDGGGAR